MGQYLASGLVYEMKASLDELHKKKISNEELRQEIEQTLLFDLNLYDETETDKALLFTLKNQVLENDLIPFLETFYPMIYENSDYEECNDVLKELRSTPVEKWPGLAEEARYMPFRYDKYAESHYIRFSKAFRPSICLDCECLMLYYGWGKIVTEGIDDFLHFFKQCINATFKSHLIAKSMQVYISS